MAKPKFKLENYPGKYVMHCNTEEKADIFCKFLHENGRKWMDGSSYLDYNYFEECSERTVYYFNEGLYGDIIFAKSECYNILEFDDFDWNMDELKVNLENLTDEERKQLVSLIEKANKPKSKVWEPKIDEQYYYVGGSGYMYCLCWSNGGFDRGCYALGNCYRTKEDAEWQLEHLKVKAELERFAEEHNEYEIDNGKQQFRWTIRCKVGGDIILLTAFDTLSADTVYFTSISIAEEAVKSIGEERLKKYYFGVEE